MWDEPDGRITRGFAGRSLVWHFALHSDDKPPPIAQLYLTACNSSNTYQRWEGATFSKSGVGKPSSVRNVGTGSFLATVVADPVTAGVCAGQEAAQFLYNASNMTMSVAVP